MQKHYLQVTIILENASLQAWAWARNECQRESWKIDFQSSLRESWKCKFNKATISLLKLKTKSWNAISSKLNSLKDLAYGAAMQKAWKTYFLTLKGWQKNDRAQAWVLSNMQSHNNNAQDIY